ncbi:MAG: hypothetical protein JWQ29_59 [Phenylobacterium sp.]|nr:hypothetical protein [Phenylobacterium sp.]
MSISAFDEPLEITCVEGEVVVTGPDGLHASLTPQAARESARRLAAAAGALQDDEGQTYQKPLG